MISVSQKTLQLLISLIYPVRTGITSLLFVIKDGSFPFSMSTIELCSTSGAFCHIETTVYSLSLALAFSPERQPADVGWQFPALFPQV